MMELEINNLISAIKIDPDFKVIMTNSLFEPNNGLSERVGEIWHSAVRENNSLFDGNTLCVASSSEKELKCFGVLYRYFLAQEKDASLRQALNLKIAAVSGLVTIDNRFLVGRRSALVTQCKELLELVPSGSLSYATLPKDGQVDYIPQLLSELSEEIGIRSTEVSHIEPFLLVKDEEIGVYDICCKIMLQRLDMYDILRNFRPAEYTELKTYSLKELGGMVREEQDDWVPASACIIRYAENLGL